MRIVFMGTPDFAAPSLRRLVEDGHEIAGVFTQPDRPKGRGYRLVPPPVKELANEYSFDVFQPKGLKNPEAQGILEELRPELIVVVAYGRILPKAVLDLPARGCINVHGSLLPKFRGAAPIQRAVMEGETVTGVTTMFMAEGLDTGDMLLRRETPIGENETAGELFERLALLGADCLSETIRRLDEIVPQKQDEALATQAPPLRKEEGEVDWNRPAPELDCQIRGVTPWPAATARLLDGRTLKIHRVKVTDFTGKPGELLDPKRLIVAAGEGSLELLEVQMEGAKRITGAELIRGQRLTPGKLF